MNQGSELKRIGETFGKCVKAARLSHGWTPEEVAGMLTRRTQDVISIEKGIFPGIVAAVSLMELLCLEPALALGISKESLRDISFEMLHKQNQAIWPEMCRVRGDGGPRSRRDLWPMDRISVEDPAFWMDEITKALSYANEALMYAPSVGLRLGRTIWGIALRLARAVIDLDRLAIVMERDVGSALRKHIPNLSQAPDAMFAALRQSTHDLVLVDGDHVSYTTTALIEDSLRYLQSQLDKGVVFGCDIDKGIAQLLQLIDRLALGAPTLLSPAVIFVFNQESRALGTAARL